MSPDILSMYKTLRTVMERPIPKLGGKTPIQILHELSEKHCPHLTLMGVKYTDNVILTRAELDLVFMMLQFGMGVYADEREKEQQRASFN